MIIINLFQQATHKSNQTLQIAITQWRKIFLKIFFQWIFTRLTRKLLNKHNELIFKCHQRNRFNLT